MKSQKIDDDIIRRVQQISVAKQENYNAETHAIGNVSEWLTMILERISAYFRERANKDDIETLIFCLQHLYYYVNNLYGTTLPALTIPTTQGVSPGILTRRHRTWTQFQEMQHLLGRIESICHLLIEAATSVLAVLDITSGPDEDELPSLVGTEQWQQAYEMLTVTLNTWQEHNGERLSFEGTFAAAKSTLTGSLLTQMDTALTLLLDSASAIFGDIIPDFQVVSQGDDEVVATLLFDLIQQADLSLMQTGTLTNPLQELIKQYAIGE